MNWIILWLLYPISCLITSFWPLLLILLKQDQEILHSAGFLYSKWYFIFQFLVLKISPVFSYLWSATARDLPNIFLILIKHLGVTVNKISWWMEIFPRNIVFGIWWMDRIERELSGPLFIAIWKGNRIETSEVAAQRAINRLPGGCDGGKGGIPRGSNGGDASWGSWGTIEALTAKSNAGDATVH